MKRFVTSAVTAAGVMLASYLFLPLPANLPERSAHQTAIAAITAITPARRIVADLTGTGDSSCGKQACRTGQWRAPRRRHTRVTRVVSAVLPRAMEGLPELGAESQDWPGAGKPYVTSPTWNTPSC